jgi:NADH dehydrogenase FAD-containing subunit
MIIFDLRDYLARADVILGEVVEVNEKSVILKDGSEIQFDYLIICSGEFYVML